LPSSDETPPFTNGRKEEEKGDEEIERGSGGGTGGGPPRKGRLHPFIQGLLDSLPEPETNWAEEGRTKWLQAAANIFDLMYKGDASITVHGVGKDKSART
jgi:hypothetical protein